MNESELRHEALIGEIGVERLELERRDHAFVHQRAGREGGEVDLQIALGSLTQTEGLSIDLDATDGLAVGSRPDAADEELFERGHRRSGQFADLIGPNRNAPPSQNREVFLGRDRLHRALDLSSQRVVGGKERDSDRVSPHFREIELGDRLQKVVGDLGDDARAITGAGIRSDRPAVLEVAQCVEREVDDVVSGRTPQGSDHRETTGVPLEIGVVETCRLGGGAEA